MLTIAAVQNRSIGRSLLRIHVTASGLALIIINGGLIGLMWESSRAESLQRLGIEASVVGSNCAAAVAFEDAATATKHLSALGALPGVLHAAVYDSHGRVFASFGDTSQRRAAREVVGVQDAIENGRLLVTRPLVSADERVGFISVVASTEPINALMVRYGVLITLLSAAAVALGALLMQRLARAITKPVMDLADITQSIAQTGDYSRRAAVQRNDEIGVLASGLDSMITAVQQRDRELERHQQQLEMLIMERTTELAQSNQRLQTELSERQRAQQSLLLAAKEWRSTFDAISDGLCILAADNRVLRCNRAMAEYLGHTPQDAVGRSLHELAPSLQQPLNDLRIKLKQTGRKANATHEAGSRWLEYTLEPLGTDSEGSVDVILLVTDVTEQRALLDQLNQSQKMEAIGRLAGGVAHDFNNILAVIQTCAAMLQRSLRDDTQAKEDLDEILHAVARATDLTRQLLAFSRKQVLQLQTLSVDDAVAASAKMLARLLGADIKLETLLYGSATYVRMDPTQFDQVLLNLAVNARDAMPKGGRITLRTRAVRAPEDVPPEVRGQLEAGHYAAISVADTGTGIRPETLAHIFEPFFTTKAKGKGTGLGLATVYGITTQSGGAIHVESAVGSGTTFTVFLKTCEAADQAAAGKKDLAEATSDCDEHVLLVEDDEQLRRAVGKLLVASGYRVTQATNGDEGLERFRANPLEFELVLTDIIMPGRSGVAMVEGIREVRPDVPVLFMSAYSEETRQGASFPDAALLIEKPFTNETLLRRLRERLDSSKPLRSSPKSAG